VTVIVVGDKAKIIDRTEKFQ